MVVAYVAKGSVSNGTDNSVEVTSPAGAIGDLLIAFMTHDDYSQGAFTAGGPLSWTAIHDGSPQRGNDSRSAIFWAIETQAAGREFTWSFTNADGWSAVIVRYSGHDATTPIQAGSTSRDGGLFIPATDADYYGDMFIGFIATDKSMSGISTPTGWTLRGISNISTAYFRTYEMAVTDSYPFPHTLQELGLDHTSTTYGDYVCYSFVIAADLTSYTISDTTKDKDGVALGSCECQLFKRVSSTNIQYVGNTTSHATTGAFTFTTYNDNDTDKFFVVSFKSTGEVHDCTYYDMDPS